MGDTRIEWCTKVWNPVTGCTKVSSGCKNCFAARMAKRLAGRCGYPADDSFRVTLHPDRVDIPLRWRKPQRVFVNSMSDLFHDDVPTEFIYRVFAVMAEASQHTFLILTKRPKRMMELLTRPTIANDVWLQTSRGVTAEPSPWPLPNVWLGVSVEDQSQDQRIRHLLATPAAVRFVSYEPALGPLNPTRVACSRWPHDAPGPAEAGMFDALTGERWALQHGQEVGRHRDPQIPTLDWIIAGGETGPGARPAHPDWFRSLCDQGAAAGVPFFFKGWGEWFPRGQWEDNPTLVLPDDSCAYIESPVTHVFTDADGPCPVHRVGKRAAGRLLDGREYSEFPEVRHAKD